MKTAVTILSLFLANATAWAQPADTSKVTTPDSANTTTGFAGSRDISELSIDELLGNASRIRFNINFFGDLSAVACDNCAPDDPSYKPGFVLDEPSMLVTADLGSSVQSLMEIAYGPHDSFVDVERFQIGWHDDQFSVVAGRIHSPLGYWNSRYHHGHWLMPTIDRPRILAFEDEGGLFPVHQVGVFGGWQTPVDTGIFRVDAGVANGRPNDPTAVATFGDDNLAKSAVVAAFIQDVGIKGLHAGVGLVYDKIAGADSMTRPALPDVPITELIGNVNVAYTGDQLLLIGEAYYLSHTAPGLSSHFLYAYALGGYRIDQWTPYVREEIFAPSGDRDPFYNPDPLMVDVEYGFSETIAGVRYNLSSWSALKAEYRLEVPLESGRETIHRGLINWSFGL